MAAADLTSITRPGYRLVERVYSGFRTLVYRAVPGAGAGCEHPTFSDLLPFRDRYAIAKTI